MNGFYKFLDNYFEVTKRKSTFKTEILAGITIFFSMSYILFVMPDTLSKAGMDGGAVFTATAISGFIATFLMGVYAKYPIALAPGMGMQAFFTYTIVLEMGYSWEEALFGIFVSGIIFMSLSLTGFRKKVIDIIPDALKYSVTIGIGLFIALIGMVDAGIVVSDPETFGTIGNFTSPITALAIIGTIIMLILVVKNINGAIFWGMFATIILGILFQLFGFDVGMVMPSALVSTPPSIEPIFGHVFQVNVGSLLLDFRFWILVFSILFVDFFDTAGTILAVGSEAGTLDKEGNIKDSSKILLVDSTSTVIGSILGVSSVTSYIESLTGIKMGARTGLSAVVVAICFLLSLFFSPLLSLIISSVTAPALITVGVLMASNHMKIDYTDFTNTATSFITVAMIVLTYSISNGLAAGLIVYTVLRTFDKKDEKVPALLYILSIIFVIYLI